MSLHPDVIDALIAGGASMELIQIACRAQHRVDEAKALAEHEIEEAKAAHKRARNAQYQSNKRIRDRGPRAPDLFERSLDDEQRYAEAAIVADAESQTSQTSQSDKRNPHKENTSSLRSEVKEGGVERAREPEPLVTALAHQIAEAIVIEAGFDPKFIPPGWCGAAMHLQDLLTQGYSENQIRIGATMTLRDFAQKNQPPPRNFKYFRVAIPSLCASMRSPIPKPPSHALEVINGGKSQSGTGTYRGGGQPRSRNVGSATDALRELREYYTRRAEEDERKADGVDHPARGIHDGRLPEG